MDTEAYEGNKSQAEHASPPHAGNSGAGNDSTASRNAGGGLKQVLSVPLLLLAGLAFLCGLYDKGLNTGLPLYYEGLGYPATIGGTLVAIYTLSSTVTRLIGGQATDHFSHMRVILVSMGLLLVGVVLPVIWDSFAIIVIARVFQGSGFALSANVISVLMQSLVPKGHLGESVGLKGAGASLSVMFGAMIATFLLDDFGFHVYFAFYIAIIVTGTIGVLLLPHTKAYQQKIGNAQSNAHGEENAPGHGPAAESKNGSGAAPKSRPQAKATKGIGADVKRGTLRTIKSFYIPQALPYLGISFAHRIIRGLCVTFILIYSRALHIGSGPIFFLVAGIATLVFRLFGGRFYDNAGDWWLFPMIAINVVGFALLAIFPCAATFYIAAICYGSSVGSSSAFLKTLTAKSVPKEHWGLAVGELFFTGDIGLASGAFFGGVALDAFGHAAFPWVALIYTAFASIITFAVLLGTRRARRQHESR